VEQSLEVEPTGAIRKANGRKAGALERGTATGKGKASKGLCADEEGPLPEPRGTGHAARNSANPRIGSGVQQTRKTARGANHQDGEKP
jgi:hypothetical protein